MAVGPVADGDPRGRGPLKMCGPESNMSVPLIKSWVLKVRTCVSLGLRSLPDT